MKKEKIHKAKLTKASSHGQVHVASKTFPEAKQIEPFSLQDKPHRLMIDENQSFIIMIDIVLEFGPYLIVTGWSSTTLEYQIICDNEHCQSSVMSVLRQDVNQHLGIDMDQKQGFALLTKCETASKENIILQIAPNNLIFVKYFKLEHSALPLDIGGVASSMGDALDVLRNVIAQNSNDWKDFLEHTHFAQQLLAYNLKNASLAVKDSLHSEEELYPDIQSTDWDVSIDGFDGIKVFGWVKRKNDDLSQLIDIYVNGYCIGTAISADNFREDLLQANIGTGHYGFCVFVEQVMYPPNDIIKVSIHENYTGCAITYKYFDICTFKNEYVIKFDKVNMHTIRGWCVNTTKPWEILELDLYIDNLHYKSIKTDCTRADLKKKNISHGLGGFFAQMPLPHMRSGTHDVTIMLPDGSYSDKHTLETTQKRYNFSINELNLLNWQVTIIVPIYNAPTDVAICINRLLEYTLPTANILLIDDCSSDSDIANILSQHRNNKRIKVLRNKSNIGFTRTINRGIVEAGEDDVILLNSDARVTPNWLQGILMAAHLTPRIATVTPMSDRAGAFSAPDKGNENYFPPYVDESTFARSFRRHSLGLYPRVPTGNGFCMYISRKCINAIGILDEEAFPRGYGEENDFCMRALRAGWLNIIDDRTYVFHERSKSFGEAKEQLMNAGRSVVNDRYPEYKNAISVFTTDEKILTARYCARRAWRDCANGIATPPRILFVVSTKTGGTPQTNQDLMTALSDSIDGFVLHCNAKKMEVSKLEKGKFHTIFHHVLDDPVDPISHLSAEYDAVIADWLFDLDIDIVHIRHLAWHSLSLARIAHNLGKKVVCSFHDYYALTPTVNLLDDMWVFEGSTFLESAADRIGLWPKAYSPTPSGAWLAHWRKRFEQAVHLCDAFVTTSDNARKLILDGLPALPSERFFVIPHGRDFPKFLKRSRHPEHGSPLRLLVPGNINRAKGLDIILALAEHDSAGLLEFHCLGNVQNVERPFPPQIIKHGTYERADFANKVAAISPHIGIVFSIWDETYCHTLTELWSVGLPSFVFDFPMVASRVQNSGAGWIVDHHDIAKLYNNIIRIAFDSEAQKQVEAALSAWQTGFGLANTTQIMAAQYYDIYAKLLRNEKVRIDSAHTPRIAVTCPCSNDLRHANASTYIRVWERTHNAPDRQIIYIRMTPQTLLACVKEGMIDGAIIQRTAIPLTMVSELLQAFLHKDIPYLLDLDDDLLHVPESKDPQGRYAAYKGALKILLRNATRVSVSTQRLKSIYGKYNNNVCLLENKLSNRLWFAPPAPRQADGIIRAVYMETDTHADDLAMILPALDAVAESEPTFRLTLIGIDGTKHLIPSRARWLESLAVPNEAKDYDLFVAWLKTVCSQFNFALAPLEDTTFNKAKSYLKLLDYAALGLPVVASNVEPYAGIDASCVSLVNNSIESWINGLRQHIINTENSDVRRAQQRAWVLDNHMLDRTLPEFDAIVSAILPILFKCQ